MANKRRKVTSKKRSSNSSREARPMEMGWRRWEDLDSDLLKKILEGLTHADLLFNVAHVCNSWRRACWDVMFWKGEGRLDLTPLQRFLNLKYDYNGEVAMKLLNFLRHIMEKNMNGETDYRCRSVTTLVFSPKLRLYDRHLSYVSERFPGLKKLIFQSPEKITGKGFSRAVRNWRDLEEIFIGRLSDLHYTHIIQEMGINCKNLKALHLFGARSGFEGDEYSTRYTNNFGCFFELDEYTSVTIVDNLPTLKVLELRVCCIFVLGLKTILIKHPQLEKIILTCCSIGERFGPLLRPVKREGGRRRRSLTRLQGNKYDIYCEMEKIIGKSGHITWLINPQENKQGIRATRPLFDAVVERFLRGWM